MLKGIAASSGVTIAPAYKYETPEIQIVKKEGVPEEEIAKFDSAVIASKKDIEIIKEKATGRLSDEELAITGKDPCYKVASEIHEGKLLYVDYSSGDFPLSLRVARHITTVAALIENMGYDYPDKEILIDNVPDYQEMVEADDIGLWLR